MKINYYKKKEMQPMYAWGPEVDMTGVSISQTDKENGSPKIGDMIAINPNFGNDRWLIDSQFFEENYEPA